MADKSHEAAQEGIAHVASDKLGDAEKKSVVPAETATTTTAAVADKKKDEKPKQTTFGMVMTSIALMSGIFLVALDANILATAIPQITSDFHSLDHVAWYGAVYALCKMVFQPTFGRLSSLFPLKVVYYVAVALIAIGSIIAAAAPSSEVLIVGRAVQGWGGAGIFSTVMTMGSFVVSKQRMPFFISVLGSMYVVASILGPIIGGVFADSYLTWRFCFWINLPIVAVTVALTYFFVPEPVREIAEHPLREKLIKLDPLGTGILIISITSLILALQWGGVTVPWSNGQVWGCLLCFGLTMVIFILYQIYQKEDALIPMRIMTRRTIAASCAVSALTIMGINVPIYYLPFYFQVSLGESTSKSGLYILPLAAFNPLASIITGIAITKTGHYVPWMIASGAIAAVGYGLLSTLGMDANLGKIIGFQVIASIGFGFGVQVPFTAMRNVLNDSDLAIANALIIFFQGFGASLSLSIGQTVFLNTLKSRLRAQLPSSEADAISQLGAGDVDAGHIKAESLPIVARAYNRSMQTAMYFAVAASVLAFCCACFVEWKKIEQPAKEKNDEEANQPPLVTEEKTEKSQERQ
jgi:MFS family permease